MQVLPSRINTEFLHLSSLVLKVLFIQTSAISLQELLQGTKHSECLGCCLAYFCSSSHHLSFLHFMVSSISCLLGDFFTFVAFARLFSPQ